MLRTLIGHEGKSAPADCKATAAVKTGMGVVIDRFAKTFSLPSAETAENIYVVNKERYASGMYTAQNDFSDYFFQFNEVAVGEFAPLYNFDFGEVFAVDQFTGLTDADKGSYVAVGVDGKWVAASVASKYKFTGLYNDNGHSLARIEVCDTAFTPSKG